MITDLMAIFSSVIERLEKAEIPCMVVGSIAAIVHGEPRMTHGLDLVVQLSPATAKAMPDLFPEAEFYCPPIEVIKAEVVQRGQFNLIHHASGLKIDLIIQKQTEHARAEFSRRAKAPFLEDREVLVASPEDVIIKKLDYFRQGGSHKHLTGIRGILAESELDQGYLDGWIDQLGLHREWEQVA